MRNFTRYYLQLYNYKKENRYITIKMWDWILANINSKSLVNSPSKITNEIAQILAFIQLFPFGMIVWAWIIENRGGRDQ